jgi:hypothetical protein
VDAGRPAGVAPSVTMSQDTAGAVTIRGIGTNSTVVGASEPTIHLDGVYLGRPAMVSRISGRERVEVLRSRGRSTGATPSAARSTSIGRQLNPQASVRHRRQLRQVAGRRSCPDR